jgi:tRNA dimethylallyltransferase
VELTRIERAPAELERRIVERAEGMVHAGLLEEVRGLISAGLKENPSAARAIGYRESIDVIEGRMPEAALAAAIAQNTRALVKKQRTWFRTQVRADRIVEAEALTDARQLSAE